MITNTGTKSVVAGGTGHAASTTYGFIGGGNGNTISTSYATIAGGQTQTASGGNSFIGGGQDNTASGAHSAIPGGQSNQATSQWSSVGGGFGNISSTAAYAHIGGGYNNAASGSASAISGGYSNTASADYAAVSGGFGNVASGADAAVGGGHSNTADGTLSWIPGGYQAKTRGLRCAYAYSGSQRAAKGDAQVIGQPVRRTTTDATPVSLATDGSPAETTVMVIPDGAVMMCRAMGVAKTPTITDSIGFVVEAVVCRTGSTTTLLSTPVTTLHGANGLSLNATIVVDNATNESVEIQVTGALATTIYWMGELHCVQVL